MLNPEKSSAENITIDSIHQRQLAQEAYLKAKAFKNANQNSEAMIAFQQAIDLLLTIPVDDKTNDDYQRLSHCYEQLATFNPEQQNLMQVRDLLKLSIDSCLEVIGKNAEENDKQRRHLIELYEHLADVETKMNNIKNAVEALNNAIFYVKDMQTVKPEDDVNFVKVHKKLDSLLSPKAITELDSPSHKRKKPDDDTQPLIPKSQQNSWFTRFTKWMKPNPAVKYSKMSTEEVEENAYQTSRNNNSSLK